MESLVLTVIGPDEPGVVERVATTVAEHHGNWTESRMSHLGGQFAGIALVQVPSDRSAALVAALGALDGLSVVTRRTDEGEPNRPYQRVSLDLIGTDHPGIVAQISAALAAHQVNVEELTTRTIDAPMSGAQMFHAEAVVAVPRDADLALIAEGLEAIATDLLVDLTFGALTE